MQKQRIPIGNLAEDNAHFPCCYRMKSPPAWTPRPLSRSSSIWETWPTPSRTRCSFPCCSRHLKATISSMMSCSSLKVKPSRFKILLAQCLSYLLPPSWHYEYFTQCLYIISTASAIWLWMPKSDWLLIGFSLNFCSCFQGLIDRQQWASLCWNFVGHIIYHGPVQDAAAYFETLGFRCPERKGVADFLQEVTSSKVTSPSHPLLLPLRQSSPRECPPAKKKKIVIPNSLVVQLELYVQGDDSASMILHSAGPRAILDWLFNALEGGHTQAVLRPVQKVQAGQSRAEPLGGTFWGWGANLWCEAHTNRIRLWVILLPSIK